MIKQIKHIVTHTQVPYENMALEEYLMETVDEDSCILYLWQNKQTVVIGRNQNPWKECKVAALEEDGGYLARRLSGGGAVFHDLGNLNFTFLVPQNLYDVSKQTEVIMRAVSSFGLRVERSGRNDITVDGRKFSGNAYYKTGKKAYHHGTLLVDVEMGRLSNYLNVSPDKLATKGVDSVRSRVVNLKDLCEEITISSLSERLIQAFEETYGLTSVPMDEGDFDHKRLKDLTEKFASWDWRLGRKMPFDVAIERRFSWGDFSLQLQIDGGMIQDAVVYSDAMDSLFMGMIPRVIMGTPYQAKSICEQIRTKLLNQQGDVGLNLEVTKKTVEDICGYLQELNF